MIKHDQLTPRYKSYKVMWNQYLSPNIDSII